MSYGRTKYGQHTYGPEDTYGLVLTGSGGATAQTVNYSYSISDGTGYAVSYAEADTVSYVYTISDGTGYAKSYAIADTVSYEYSIGTAVGTVYEYAVAQPVNYSYTINTAFGDVDDILVLLVPDSVSSLQFNADEINDEMIQPKGQSQFVPIFKITNQTPNQNTVQIRWDNSLDATLDVGVSDQPEEDYNNTINTSDTYTDLVTLSSGESGRVWMYANFENNSFGQLLNNQLRIEKK